MLAANYSTVRNDFKSYCDKVYAEDEAVIVTRKDQKNVVIISMAEYNLTRKLRANAEYLRKIDKAMQQFAEGKEQFHELIEVD
jgi:antitoxin YefM